MGATIARPPRALAAATASVLALGAALSIAGCGATSGKQSRPISTLATPPGLPADALPVPTGRSSAYRLAATSGRVSRRAPVGALRCLGAHPPSYGAHLELYAGRLVLPVPAGIGVAPPLVRRGVYVLGGACSYPVRTFEPTGVVVVDGGRPPTLAALFALWGQTLTAHTIAGFHGQVLAFVGGRRWQGAPGAIALSPHAEIVLQVGGRLPPHTKYRFPPGL
jgi:hypothetical protein